MRRKLPMTKASIIMLLLISGYSLANDLPQTANVPGGVVILDTPKDYNKAPMAFYQHHRVLMIKQNDKWRAMVGIPLDAKPGPHKLTIIADNQADFIHFDIINKDYPAQYITLKNKRMVNPNPDDLARIKQERIPITKALDTWTETLIINTDFIPPVQGQLSSRFGLKRFFNNQAKNPHSGLDIAAPTGTDIVAPGPATVINTGNYYYNGNSVFLDHGQGLITGYFHMSDIAVKDGQTVKQGDLLGSVGETGRVTGPHLHWNVYLNSYKVDPTLFIAPYMKQLQSADSE